MTPDQTRQILDLAWSQWPTTEQDRNAYTTWHVFLSEHSMEDVSQAVKAVIREAREFRPTIAQVMDEIENPTLRKKRKIVHPPDCHCADYIHGGLFVSRFGPMNCPGPLGPEALRAYEDEWIANDDAERAGQPHIRALPKPDEIALPDFGSLINPPDDEKEAS